LKKKHTRKKLWALLKQIPKGRVTTYKVLSIQLKTSPRAVGAMLKTNPDAQNTPCFKVVHSDGKVGGYSLGRKEKEKRLGREGIKTRDGKIMNFKQIKYDFT